MLTILNADHAEFRTDWFVDCLATQTLFVFLIRTRRVPSSAADPVPRWSSLPLAFFLILLGTVLTYLALVEIAKGRRFYARERGRLGAPADDA
jgi:P-type Mg2+ transporter